MHHRGIYNTAPVSIVDNFAIRCTANLGCFYLMHTLHGLNSMCYDIEQLSSLRKKDPFFVAKRGSLSIMAICIVVVTVSV